MTKKTEHQPDPYVRYNELDEERREYVDKHPYLKVDLVKRIYRDDRLLSRDEFESMFRGE
jgi:hypothetical protein